MTGYMPEQMPVLSAIARGFATFDHWFCDVPTCTYPNRSGSCSFIEPQGTSRFTPVVAARR